MTLVEKAQPYIHIAAFPKNIAIEVYKHQLQEFYNICRNKPLSKNRTVCHPCVIEAYETLAKIINNTNAS